MSARAISIKCPECGGAMAAQAKDAVATCEYCGTTSQIRRRTGLFRIAGPAPSEDLEGYPVATVRGPGERVGIVVLIVLIVGLGGVAALVSKKNTSSSARTSTAPRISIPSLEEPSWLGGRGVALADVDGDGVDDVIGRLSVTLPHSQILIAAYDGKTGAPLWTSDSIGARADVTEAVLGVTGEHLVVSDGSAGLMALSTADGRLRWKTRLDEKIDRICAGAPGAVHIKTADDKLHAVSLSDGAPLPAPADRRCAPLAGDGHRDDQPTAIQYGLAGKHHHLLVRDAIEGLNSRRSLHHPPSGATIALGHRTPGARVPMLASYRWAEPPPTTPVPRAQRPAPEVLWTALVPAVDPLTVRHRSADPSDVAIGGGAVVAVYQLRETGRHHLTALALDDGRRLWDVEVPGEGATVRVAASDTHALVSRWDAVYAFDLATGEHVYTIR